MHPRLSAYRYTVDTVLGKTTATPSYLRPADIASELRYLTSTEEHSARARACVLNGAGFCFLIFFRLVNHKSPTLFDRTAVPPSFKGASARAFIHPFTAVCLSFSTVFSYPVYPSRSFFSPSLYFPFRFVFTLPRWQKVNR